ncbi:hypothetical protein F5144DRAFT_202184 [Chaetomium tenue]|uniref:Uncharacterized protein n=1 Tax=Chaetomium tenue TaxID=1854479 RepID=A0ACB7PCZ3_9PEZI|nr:hypothetical protein F5144DRAFT_202184 [Chaetomium globosum]
MSQPAASRKGRFRAVGCLPRRHFPGGLPFPIPSLLFLLFHWLETGIPRRLLVPHEARVPYRRSSTRHVTRRGSQCKFRHSLLDRDLSRGLGDPSRHMILRSASSHCRAASDKQKQASGRRKRTKKLSSAGECGKWARGNGKWRWPCLIPNFVNQASHSQFLTLAHPPFSCATTSLT